MASASNGRPGQARDIPVARLIVAGGLTFALVFILCWLATLIPIDGPTHAYLALFTGKDPGSVQALSEGALWSLIFGGLTAGLFALVYNFCGRFTRQSGDNQ